MGALDIWLDRLWSDLRYALRSSSRNLSFSAAAVLSIALGVGSATAIFAIADAVFLRPLPYAHPEQLVSVGIRFPFMPMEFLASPDYVAWRRDNRTFAGLAATQAGGPQAVLLNGTQPAELQLARVSANFLPTLGLVPALGRNFLAAEELPAAPGTVLLSYSLWKSRFGAAPDTVGRILSLNGQRYTVVGVLPSRFTFPADAAVDLLATLPVSPVASHHDQSMSLWSAVGRLRPGISVRDSRADLDHLFALSKADLPRMFQSDSALVVEPLQQHRIRDARKLFLVLLATVTCLLLISCANVANLLLGRWAERRHEIAIRMALGAGQARLRRQLFTETVVLAAAGAALGTLFAAVSIRTFVHWAAGSVPRLAEVTVDGRVLLIGILVSALTTLLFGVMPSLVAARPQVRQADFRFVRQVLVVSEVALSVVLLTSAALLLQSLWNLRNHQLGFEAEHALTVTVPANGTAIEKRQIGFASAFLQFLRSMPGTVAAAQSECTPLTGGAMQLTFSRIDRPLPKPFERGRNVYVCGAGVGYDQASGQHLVRGRYFSPSDSAHPQTLAVINETAARAYFPGEDPLGKQILGGRASGWKTVVGIISDSKNAGLSAPPAPQAIVNEPSSPAQRPQFIVRSVAYPRLLESSIAVWLKGFDAGLIASYKTLADDMTEKTAGPSFDAFLIAGFAVVAFVITIVGIYGVLSFATSARTREIGIRLAIGAQPGRVFTAVLFEGMMLTLIGVGAGSVATLALSRYARSMLYGVTATDLTTYAAVGAALLITALLAAALPARRAAAVDPAVALRHT